MARTPGRLAICLALIAPFALPAADAGKALLDAASQGRTSSVQELVGKGAPLETRDKDGRTPLLLAAQHGHAATVQLLLEKGADAAATDRSGATAWVLAMFAPGGSRGGNEEVLKLLPRPPRPRVAIEAVWTTNNLFNSCIMRLDELTRFVSGLEPDLLALAAFRRYANVSGKDLIEITGSNGRGVAAPGDEAFADSDAVLILNVRPSANCVPQQSADQLSLALDMQLLRSRDRAALLRKTIGGGSLRSRIVTGQAQYPPVYQEWIKPYAEQAYWPAVEAWFRGQ